MTMTRLRLTWPRRSIQDQPAAGTSLSPRAVRKERACMAGNKDCEAQLRGQGRSQLQLGTEDQNQPAAGTALSPRAVMRERNDIVEGLPHTTDTKGHNGLITDRKSLCFAD